MHLPALTLAGALLVQAPASLGREELLALADSGFTLAMVEECRLWGDAAWLDEARRRIRLLLSYRTSSRRERAVFEGAFAMAERRGRELVALLGPIACRGVEISGRDVYDRLLADDRLHGSWEPPATQD